MAKKNKKLPRFEVGDVVEEVITRQFTVRIVGRYYGRRLYCADENDTGQVADHLRLVKKAPKGPKVCQHHGPDCVAVGKPGHPIGRARSEP